jgi:phospholipid/cholesterol/gamma-HCH transport system substrate-binding protein
MKKEVKLGLFLMAIFVIFAYFIIKTQSCSELLSRGKRYPIEAKFASVAGMYTTAPVRLAGVKIGIVNSIYLEGRKAVVRMMIDKKYTILSDARALISTIGFVGEKYIEIVYKDEFNLKNPTIIQPGGEILVIEPFNLDEIKAKFDNIYDRTIQITDSINAIVSDPGTQESLRASFANFKAVSGSLKDMLAEGGRVSGFIGDLSAIADKLQGTVDKADRLVAELDRGIGGEDQGMLKDLRAAAASIQKATGDLSQISADLRQGRGTAGKLLRDEDLYKKIDDSVTSVHALLSDLEKKKQAIDAIAFNYAVHFDYFTRLKKARSALELDVSTPHFLVMTGVDEDPASGTPLFTALGGRRIALVSVAAGLVESDLGAALRLDLLGTRLKLDLYAYRFTREKNPLLKAMLRFSLSRNIRLQAGYYDLLRSEGREFMMGISFGN